MDHDLAEILKAIDSAHRRVDELRIQVVRLEGQMEGQSAAIKKLEDVPSRLSSIETKLGAIESRLPQQAAPISPWSVLLMVLGWGISIVLAVVAWTQ